MKFFKPASILAVMVVLAGCVIEELPVEPTTPDIPDMPGGQFDGVYRLVDIDGNQIPGNASLVIAGNSMHGEGPCNSFTSQNDAKWPKVSLTVASTMRACITEGGEGLFFEALNDATVARMRNGNLEFSGPSHSMMFESD